MYIYLVYTRIHTLCGVLEGGACILLYGLGSMGPCCRYCCTVDSMRYYTKHSRRSSSAPYTEYHITCTWYATCRLCSTHCPSYAISIMVGISGVLSRDTCSYTLCTSRCIYCGMCDTVCPVSASTTPSALRTGSRHTAITH